MNEKLPDLTGKGLLISAKRDGVSDGAALPTPSRKPCGRRQISAKSSCGRFWLRTEKT